MSPRALFRSAWACVLVISLGACAQIPLSDELSGLPAQAYIAEVPFFPQDTNQCGPAALATILAYRGVDTTPEMLEPALYIPAKQGSLPLELHAQARRHGLLSYPLGPHLSDVLREVAAGNPVLVFQNLGLKMWAQYHFAVIVGYDLRDGVLILRSGEEQTLRTRWRSFRNTWERSEYWARVILPTDQIPATAKPLPYLAAIAELEQTGHYAEAKAGYINALNHWSHQQEVITLANLALANIDYRRGDYVAAESRLRENIRTDPRDINSWNNLAYALLARECAEAAVQALQCGIGQAPENENLRDSLVEIQTPRPVTKKLNGPHCKPVLCLQQ